MLVGINTLDVLFNLYTETDLTSRQPLPYGYKVVLKMIDLRWKRAINNHQGIVKKNGDTLQVIPAGETVVVKGVSLVRGFQDERAVVIRYPSSSSFPCGLLVKSGLVDFPQLCPYKLLVLRNNESDHDIVIPAKCTTAECFSDHFIKTK